MHIAAHTNTNAAMIHCVRRSARRGDRCALRWMGTAMLTITIERRMSVDTASLRVHGGGDATRVRDGRVGGQAPAETGRRRATA